jgi:hypothetical protein
MSYKAFISHSNSDHRLVNHLYKVLAHFGITVYLAEYDLQPFQFLSTKVTQNIKDSDCVIVLLTKNGLASKYVHNEIGIAIGFGRPIIPIVEKGTSQNELAVLQGREYIEYEPNNSEVVLIKTAEYVRTLKLRKEDQQRTLIALGSIVGLLLLLGKNN